MGKSVRTIALQLEYQRQQLINERQAFHLDQLKVLEARAKQDAHGKLVQSGQLPANLPSNFDNVVQPPKEPEKSK